MRGFMLTCTLLAFGCRGETVSSGSPDAGDTSEGADPAEVAPSTDSVASDALAEATRDTSDETDTSDTSRAETGGCPTGSANLLSNPSLEAWTGTVPDDFTANTNVTVTKISGDAGGNVARLGWSVVGYGMYQRVTLMKPLPAGCKVLVRARARWVSGATNPPSLIATLADANDVPQKDGEVISWTPDGSWHERSMVVTADRLTVKISVFVVGNVTSAQSVDVDDFELTYVP